MKSFLLQTKEMLKKLNELAIIPKLPLSIGDPLHRCSRWVTNEPSTYWMRKDFEGGLNDSLLLNV
jgi:hypothetical protein